MKYFITFDMQVKQSFQKVCYIISDLKIEIFHRRESYSWHLNGDKIVWIWYDLNLVYNKDTLNWSRKLTIHWRNPIQFGDINQNNSCAIAILLWINFSVVYLLKDSIFLKKQSPGFTWIHFLCFIIVSKEIVKASAAVSFFVYGS